MSGWNQAFERLRAKLQDRRMAYRAVFESPGGDLNPMAQIVMRDLAKYCYANKPTLKVSHITQQSDPTAMAFAEGRRDVYNRISAMLNLTDDQIARIANHRTNDD